MSKIIPANAVVKINLSVKCFLCNKSFFENKDETCCIFAKRFQENGKEVCSVSSVFETAFALQLTENNVHSKVLCSDCYALILEYEEIEQRYCELKYKIIEEYNRTAKIYGFDMVEHEILSLIEKDANYDENFTNEEHMGDEDDSNDAQEINSETVVQTDLINFYVTNDLSESNFEIPEHTDECSENLGENISSDVHYEQVIDNGHSLANITEVDENLETTIEFVEDGLEQDDTNDEEEKEDDMFEMDNMSLIKIQNDEQEMNKQENTKYITTDNARPSFQFDGEKYKCLCCEDSKALLQEYDAKSIGVHLKTIHNIRISVCQACGKGFGKRTELTLHIEKDHPNNENGQFQCETCLKIFSNLGLFKIHRRTHYNVMKTFECSVCNKKYSSKNLLDEHMNMHSGSRPFKCIECSKDFASKYTLNAHMKTHLNRPRPFSCADCPKTFFSAQNLLQHQKTHSGVKEFLCDICQKAFGTEHNLNVHKVVHTGYKPFICRTCGKAFARRAEIKDHERTHTGEKPFSCDICGLAFAQRSNLTTHKRATHMNDKRYKCTECDRSFKRRRLLDYHTRASHTGERPYKCNICASSFVYPEHYKKHLKLHTGVKPYSCEVCGKTFNSRDNRNAHRFIHSDKKPYECLVCGLGFMRKPLLYNHMQASGHLNDTIIVNQPQIKNEDDEKSSGTVEGIKMFINSDNMIIDDDDESNEIIEEHLIEEHLNENYKNHDEDSTILSNEILNDDEDITELIIPGPIPSEHQIKHEVDDTFL